MLKNLFSLIIKHVRNYYFIILFTFSLIIHKKNIFNKILQDEQYFPHR